jgi:hypothetical protein
MFSDHQPQNHALRYLLRNGRAGRDAGTHIAGLDLVIGLTLQRPQVIHSGIAHGLGVEFGCVG